MRSPRQLGQLYLPLTSATIAWNVLRSMPSQRACTQNLHVSHSTISWSSARWQVMQIGQYCFALNCLPQASHMV